jgi:hypothetical protein
LGLDPERLESYHSLFDLWARLGQPSQAWCVAGLLVGMGEATLEESAAYESARPKGLSAVDRLGAMDLDDKLAGHDGDLSRVFELLYQTLSDSLDTSPAEALGVGKKDRVKPEDRTLALTMIRRVAQTLGVPMPEVYIDHRREGLRVLPLVPPALGLSPSMMSGKAPRELIFHATRALYGLHPRRVLAALYEPERLETLLMAAMEQVCEDGSPALREDLGAAELRLLKKHVRATRDALERSLTDTTREELSALLSPYASGSARPDVGQWLLNAAVARNHAALTVCGDVALAVHLLRDDESGELPLGRGDQLRHLVNFAVSDEHQALRSALHDSPTAERA